MHLGLIVYMLVNYVFLMICVMTLYSGKMQVNELATLNVVIKMLTILSIFFTLMVILEHHKIWERLL